MKLDEIIYQAIENLYNNLDIKDKDKRIIYLLKLLYFKKEALLNWQMVYENKQLELYEIYKKQYQKITTLIDKEIKRKIDKELIELKYKIKTIEIEIEIIEKAISIIQTIMKTYDTI